MSPNLETSFWVRMGLDESARDGCLRAVEEIYPGHIVEEFGEQGYCSFTLSVQWRQTRSSYIVQIRPQQHALDLRVAETARKIYGALAPRVRSLNVELPGSLVAFEMDRLDGVPLSRLQHRSPVLSSASLTKQITLTESFASFVARGWPATSDGRRQSRCVRADSPVFDGPSWLAGCTGTVGANIVPKLQKLARELPAPSLRRRAKETLDGLLAIDEYPVVLNHGDLIPTNVLADEETCEITGLVDWAEAEELPFGTCLYGLEHLLGFLTCSSSSKPTWQYYEDANILRRTFWARLVQERPAFEGRLNDVRLMRDVGVLLWLGYAWDEGKIDRVVNELDDGAEVVCLRTFLAIDRSDSPDDYWDAVGGVIVVDR